MKKILICLSFMLMIIKVDAFEIGEWTDEVIEDPNIIVQASEVRYQWYENVAEFAPDYYIEGENDPQYPYIFRYNYSETEWSSWDEEVPLNKANREIEIWNTGRYRTLRPIRYLFFNNVKGGFLTFRIAELNILINNIPIDVEMICTNCSQNFNVDVTDGLLTDAAYINDGGSLMIDLRDYYGIDEIAIELFMYDETPNIKTFDLYYNEGDSIADRNYARKEIISYVISSNPSLPERYFIMANSSFIVNPVYDDWIYIDGIVNATYYRQMQFLNMYRYKDIKYSYYKPVRSYVDGYYVQYDDPGYMKDEDSAKTFYLYQYNSIEEDSDNNLVELDKDEPDQPTSVNDSDEPIDKSQGMKPQPIKTSNTMDSNDSTLLKDSEDNSYEDELLTEEKIEDLLVINDYPKKAMHKKNTFLEKRNIFNNKLLLLSGILFAFLIIILVRLRHHNLSHQK